jgi:hypothetical protein
MYQLTQLAREHQRQMLAQASQRPRRHQHGYPAPRTPGPAARGARRLAAAIARAGAVAAQAPGAIWRAGSHRLGEPAARPRSQAAATDGRDTRRRQPARRNPPPFHAAMDGVAGNVTGRGWQNPAYRSAIARA